MKVYKYDEKSGELIEEQDAILDPLETKIQEKDIYLLPASSTFVEPPALRNGFARVFKDNWEYIADHRGEKCIKDGKITKINELGEFITITTEQEKGVLEGNFVIENNQIREKTFLEKQQDLSLQKRHDRDVMLKATDVYMLIDFPISDEQRELYKQYRQYLRDFPAMEGFPEIGVMSFKEWQQWIGD